MATAHSAMSLPCTPMVLWAQNRVNKCSATIDKRTDTLRGMVVQAWVHRHLAAYGRKAEGADRVPVTTVTAHDGSSCSLQDECINGGCQPGTLQPCSSLLIAGRTNTSGTASRSSCERH